MPRQSSLGLLVARVLTGAWRLRPLERMPADRDLQRVVSVLRPSGAGALVWWKIRSSHDHSISLIDSLNKVRLEYAAQAIQYEEQLLDIFRSFTSLGIRAILLKGWSVARFYPATGLRPLGDIDLLVADSERNLAQEAIRQLKCKRFPVDLNHDEFPRFGESSFEQLYDRSEQSNLQDSAIRVLCPEDHLRLLCLHFLKHGGWRPLWLCDIAAALEKLPVTFSWNRCLGCCDRYAEWIACTIEVARELLGAQPAVELSFHRRTIPRWFLSAILKEWSFCRSPTRPRFSQLIPGQLRNPALLLKELRLRWPNAIQATVDTHAPLNSYPRALFQVQNYLFRAVHLGRKT
jgi:hypothetical protein